jgi:integrase
MPRMGRRRKTDDGLEPRVYSNHGAFYYAHPADKARGVKARWEHLGFDKEAANRRARAYNTMDAKLGTLVYWLDQWLLDCERRVAAGSLAARTLKDYSHDIGTDEKPGPLRIFFAPPMTPYDVTPDVVQDYLDEGAEADRGTRANRERAALSSCFGWLLRKKHCPGLMVNPCLRASGVQRNTEGVRQRYVSDADYNDVHAVATRAERLMMALVYRTLQRPESDIIRWDTSIVKHGPSGRRLEFTQRKTGQRMVIAFSPDLDLLIPPERTGIQFLREPIVRKLDGDFYTYSGLSSMLRRSIEAANESRRARKQPEIESFGFRDIKGKGATDMWLASTPVEQIQALCGHKNKSTTEKYIKARWHEAAQPNTLTIGAA